MVCGHERPNAGTLAAPFATINKGISMLDSPGDVLSIRGGTYNQLVTVWNVINSGTTITAVTTDYWGGARGTQYDIGADEY